MIELLLFVNIALTSGVGMYVIRVEHRLTKLETQMAMVLHRLRLADE